MSAEPELSNDPDPEQWVGTGTVRFNVSSDFKFVGPPPAAGQPFKVQDVGGIIVEGWLLVSLELDDGRWYFELETTADQARRLLVVAASRGIEVN